MLCSAASKTKKTTRRRSNETPENCHPNANPNSRQKLTKSGRRHKNTLEIGKNKGGALFGPLAGAPFEHRKGQKCGASAGLVGIYAVKLLSGPSLGFSKVINWASQIYYLGQVGFRTIKIGVSGDFCFAQLSFYVFLCPVICYFSKNSLFRKKGAKLGFPNFSVLSYFF